MPVDAGTMNKLLSNDLRGEGMQVFNRLVWASVFLFVSLLAGCGGGGSSGNPGSPGSPGSSGTPGAVNPPANNLAFISVSPSYPASLAKGLTQKFTATGYYLNGSTLDITSSATWNSVSPTVATVDTSGLATGTGVGSTNITASFGGVTSTFVSLTVTPAELTAIAVSPGSATTTAGLSKQFTATGTFTDGTTQDVSGSVSWGVTNRAVASVNGVGLAMGVSEGTTTITATKLGFGASVSNSATLTVVKYIVGGTVTSLPAGGSVVLQNNGADTITVGTNGSFVFPTPQVSGATYNVTVLTQPGAPAHPCVVAGSSGAITNTYISSVQVVCAAAVTTFAGGTYGAANGTGTAASFSSPNGVAVDSAGNVYVADKSNQLIRKITPAGVVSTLAGTVGVTGYADGTGTAAIFNNPAGVAVDTAGNVYVADDWNQVIRKITPAGAVTTFAGTVQTGMTTPSFGMPVGVAVDGAGTVYVADGLGLIRKVTPAGVVSDWAGTMNLVGAVNGPGNVATFYNPTGVAVDTAGNAYVADQYNHLIRKITSAGVVSTLAGTAGVSGAANGTGTAATFNRPNSVAVDSAGNVYVADTGNGLIRLITPAGVVTTLAGCWSNCSPYRDGPALSATFLAPMGLAVDAAGNVYVADTSIRKITP